MVDNKDAIKAIYNKYTNSFIDDIVRFVFVVQDQDSLTKFKKELISINENKEYLTAKLHHQSIVATTLIRAPQVITKFNPACVVYISTMPSIKANTVILSTGIIQDDSTIKHSQYAAVFYQQACFVYNFARDLEPIKDNTGSNSLTKLLDLCNTLKIEIDFVHSSFLETAFKFVAKTLETSASIWNTVKVSSFARVNSRQQ
jgi:hypothetical protein